MRQLLFLFIAVLLVTACKPKPSVSDNGAGDGGITDLSAAERVMQQMIEAQNVVDWLDARARVRIESPDMNVGGTAFIRLKRDEWVWASVKKFGFEAARVLVTPDSVYVINRLDNSYSIEPLSYLESRYKMPARFDLLQQVVIGNPIFFDRDLAHETTTEQHRLFGKSSRWESDYWLDLDTYSLQRMRLAEVGSDRSLDLELSDFRDVGLKNGFSHERIVSIDAPDTGNSRVELSFNRLTVNEPIDYVFDIPDRFERQ
ncbi:MAG: DUF4292 domain-containing protein [Bacteroidota bacterium]